jgi:hypothetical protein
MESWRFLWRALREEGKLIAFRFNSNISADHQPPSRPLANTHLPLSMAPVKRGVQDAVAGLSRANLN